jgi:hypothetical protein
MRLRDPDRYLPDPGYEPDAEMCGYCGQVEVDDADDFIGSGIHALHVCPACYAELRPEQDEPEDV